MRKFLNRSPHPHLWKIVACGGFVENMAKIDQRLEIRFSRGSEILGFCATTPLGRLRLWWWICVRADCFGGDSLHLAPRANFQCCVLMFLIKNDFGRFCGQIWVCGGFAKENKVKTATKQNARQQTPNADRHYLRETNADRNVQNQHLTRTNDKITLNRRERGKPFLSWNKGCDLRRF